MGYFKRKVDRDRARRLLRALDDEGSVARPWEAIPDPAVPTRRFVRFSSRDRHARSQRRKGIFAATHDLLEQGGLDAPSTRHLKDALSWFGEHLISPDLDEARAIFLFKSDAAACMQQIWVLVFGLREAGVWVEMQTFENPGRVLYEDELQVAVIPWADEETI